MILKELQPIRRWFLGLLLEILVKVPEALISKPGMIITVVRDHQGWKKDMNDLVYLVLKHYERDIVTFLQVFKVANAAIMRVSPPSAPPKFHLRQSPIKQITSM
jgi:hypothetical protein